MRKIMTIFGKKMTTAIAKVRPSAMVLPQAMHRRESDTQSPSSMLEFIGIMGAKSTFPTPSQRRR